MENWRFDIERDDVCADENTVTLRKAREPNDTHIILAKSENLAISGFHLYPSRTSLLPELRRKYWNGLTK